MIFLPRAKGRLIWFSITTPKINVDTISVEGLKSMFLLLPQLCFTIKECKIDSSNNIWLIDTNNIAKITVLKI